MVQVEFLPGRVAELPAFEARGVAKYVVCKLARQPDGRYILVPQEWQQFVRVTDHLCQDLGLPCTQRQLARLARAGFLESSQVTPRGLWVSLTSILAHFEATRIIEDEPSWWTAERLETYYYANVEVRPDRPTRSREDEEEAEDEEEPKPKAKKAKKAAASAPAAGQLDFWAA